MSTEKRFQNFICQLHSSRLLYTTTFCWKIKFSRKMKKNPGASSVDSALNKMCGMMPSDTHSFSAPALAQPSTSSAHDKKKKKKKKSKEVDKERPKGPSKKQPSKSQPSDRPHSNSPQLYPRRSASQQLHKQDSNSQQNSQLHASQSSSHDPYEKHSNSHVNSQVHASQLSSQEQNKQHSNSQRNSQLHASQSPLQEPYKQHSNSHVNSQVHASQLSLPQSGKERSNSHINSQLHASQSSFQQPQHSTQKKPRKETNVQQSTQLQPCTSTEPRRNVTPSAPITVDLSKILDRLDSLNRRMVKIDGNITATNARMVTLEKDMKLVKESLAQVEQLDTSIDRTLKGIAKKQNRKAVPRPSFLPFKTSADILAFNYASEEDYNTLVEYLSSQGGANFTDSAAIYFRECIVIDQDIFRNVTWSTSKAEGTMALKDTRFANACKDSMPADKTTLRAPEPTDFKVAMMKALKSAKEAFRRKMKRPADNPIEPPPPIHRPRVVLASDLDEEQDGEQSAGSEDDNDEEQDTESKSGTDDESGTESEVDDDDAGITDGEISDQGDDNDDDHIKRDYASDASEIFNNF